MHFLQRLILILVNKTKGSSSDSYKKLKDKALVEKIVATKNTLLFGVLYDRYSKKVYNKCYSFSKNEEEAKDLTQDVFLKLYIKLHTFKGKSKFSTWLYSFTYNFCVNYKNRNKEKKLNDLSDSLDDHEHYLNAIEDVTEEELFSMKISKLKKALELIDPEDKAILLLKYQDDASIKDIQVLMGIGESAAKMRLKRAKLKVLEQHNKLNDGQ